MVADVPGLIEGAPAGAGLGHRFLRHLERTRVLLHLLELSSIPGRTPLRDYQILRRELALHDPALAGRTEVVVLNKLDLPATRKKFPALQRLFARRGLHLLGVSAATGAGMDGLLAAAWSALEQARADGVATKDLTPRRANGCDPHYLTRDPTI